MPLYSKAGEEPGCPAYTPQVPPQPDTGHLQLPRALRPHRAVTTARHRTPSKIETPAVPFVPAPLLSFSSAGRVPAPEPGVAAAPQRSVRGLPANNARLFWRSSPAAPRRSPPAGTAALLPALPPPAPPRCRHGPGPRTPAPGPSLFPYLRRESPAAPARRAAAAAGRAAPAATAPRPPRSVSSPPWHGTARPGVKSSRRSPRPPRGGLEGLGGLGGSSRAHPPPAGLGRPRTGGRRSTHPSPRPPRGERSRGQRRGASQERRGRASGAARRPEGRRRDSPRTAGQRGSSAGRLRPFTCEKAAVAAAARTRHPLAPRPPATRCPRRNPARGGAHSRPARHLRAPGRVRVCAGARPARPLRRGGGSGAGP